MSVIVFTGLPGVFMTRKVVKNYVAENNISDHHRKRKRYECLE